MNETRWSQSGYLHFTVEPYAGHSMSPTVLAGISVSQGEIVCAYSITFCWRKNSHLYLYVCPCISIRLININLVPSVQVIGNVNTDDQTPIPTFPRGGGWGYATEDLFNCLHC